MSERFDRPLEVRPVRRYSVPRYPSHRHPDPTRHPRDVPYPFGQSVVRVAASLGLMATLIGAGCADEGGGGAPVARAPNPPPKPPPNPLTLGQSGLPLPYRNSGFGTGAPSPIDDAIAREVIDRLFLDAGYALRPDWRYDQAGVSFTADGFDPARKVGYVFATEEDLEADAIEVGPWDDKLVGAERDLANLRHGLPIDVRKRVDEAKAIGDPKAREAALVAIRDEVGETRFSMADGRELERRAERHEGFVAVIAQTDRRFTPQSDSSQSAADAWRAAYEIPDPFARKQALAALEKKRAKKALDALEQAVREYIAWVQSQGG